jgi:hypothetical protein
MKVHYLRVKNISIDTSFDMSVVTISQYYPHKCIDNKTLLKCISPLLNFIAITKNTHVRTHVPTLWRGHGLPYSLT